LPDGSRPAARKMKFGKSAIRRSRGANKDVRGSSQKGTTIHLQRSCKPDSLDLSPREVND